MDQEVDVDQEFEMDEDVEMDEVFQDDGVGFWDGLDEMLVSTNWDDEQDANSTKAALVIGGGLALAAAIIEDPQTAWDVLVIAFKFFVGYVIFAVLAILVTENWAQIIHGIEILLIAGVAIAVLVGLFQWPAFREFMCGVLVVGLIAFGLWGLVKLAAAILPYVAMFLGGAAVLIGLICLFMWPPFQKFMGVVLVVGLIAFGVWGLVTIAAAILPYVAILAGGILAIWLIVKVLSNSTCRGIILFVLCCVGSYCGCGALVNAFR